MADPGSGVRRVAVAIGHFGSGLLASPQTKALSPVSDRPTMSVLISRVPS